MCLLFLFVPLRVIIIGFSNSSFLSFFMFLYPPRPSFYLCQYVCLCSRLTKGLKLLFPFIFFFLLLMSCFSSILFIFLLLRLYIINKCYKCLSIYMLLYVFSLIFSSIFIFHEFHLVLINYTMYTDLNKTLCPSMYLSSYCNMN